MVKYGFLFPGQGAQFPGMMKDLCEKFADGKGFFEYVNNTFARQMNTDKENLINHSVSDFVPDRENKIFDSSLIEFSELTFFKNEKEENIELFVA